MSTPSAVVATIPTRALRCICLSDPSLSELDASLSKLKIESDNKENEPHRLPRQAKNVSISYKITTTKTTKKTPEDSQTTKKSAKELSRPESSRRIVEEIERLAVHHLCQHHAPAVHLVQAVDALDINHEAMGNNGTSKNVAAKRLREHITNLPGGLSTYLEKEASSDFLDDLVNRVLITDKDRALSRKSQKVEAVVNALQHEAMVTFFESLQEHELHKICRAMKNEGEEPETRSRSVLAASIINNQPVSELILPGAKKENKKKQLSKKKPKLAEGVSYDDVFQWYKLSELQEFAREHELKVSGKKKELICRILAFLANGSTLPSQPRKKKQASKASKRSRSSTKNVEATPELSKRISELLEAIKKGSKAVNESLPQEEIDELEKRIRKANGSGMRLPPGLRQLYATCDGFSVHGDWTWGVNIYSSKEVNGKEDTEDFIGGDSLVKEWLESRVAEGMKPEESIAHPSWLLIGCCSEYDCLFVNIDPSSENYGAVNWATNNCDSEIDHCKSVEELLEKTAAYVARREKARKKFAEEEPDADEDMLEDYVIDQIVYDEEDDDDDEEEEDDGEEEKNSDVAEDGDE